MELGCLFLGLGDQEDAIVEAGEGGGVGEEGEEVEAVLFVVGADGGGEGFLLLGDFNHVASGELGASEIKRGFREGVGGRAGVGGGGAVVCALSRISAAALVRSGVSS